MRPKLILILTLIVLLPTGTLAWLGWRMARQEQEVVGNRFREALSGRLRDIQAGVVRTLEKQETELLRLLDRGSYETADLRELVRKSPSIHAVFVLDKTGNRQHPPPEGPLTNYEREFLERSGQIWRDKQVFYSASEGPGQNSNYGWYTWYWGNGVNLLFWVRDASGHVIGAEYDRSRMLADIVGELPDSDPSDPDLRQARIALTGDNGVAVYQWGTYEPAEKEQPQVTLGLSHPLDSWSLQYFSAAAESNSAFGGGLLFNLAAGMAALVLVLIGLAFYFYRESTREMREAAERVSFVNQVSHELKTPLTNIRMYAELLEQSLPDDDRRTSQHLDIIVSESQRLSRLIGNVLTFARKQNDKLALHYTAGNIDQCIQFVLDHFTAALESRGVKTVFTRGADATVEFDRDAVEQILGNLFSNVEKYAAAGGLLEVTSRLDGSRTSITISDRGPGIPKGQEEKIFAPFHRLSNKLSDGVTGTGIGLTIARDLARRHGGDLRAVAADAGARFVLELHTPPSPVKDAKETRK
ncbi:MAG TPA: HAMP domain-containing sensor histidine kinase [Terriglobia bacterium]|nr:HAMP domain-containing sensor histidine kinase [Terriglobia bacterium]